MSSPSKRIGPGSVDRAGSSAPVVVLPQPDSPTSASVSPGGCRVKPVNRPQSPRPAMPVWDGLGTRRLMTRARRAGYRPCSGWVDHGTGSRSSAQQAAWCAPPCFEGRGLRSRIVREPIRSAVERRTQR